MPYHCRTCDWIDECDPQSGDAEEPACHRCGSSVIDISTDELLARFDGGEVCYCNACQRVHSR